MYHISGSSPASTPGTVIAIYSIEYRILALWSASARARGGGCALRAAAVQRLARRGVRAPSLRDFRALLFSERATTDELESDW